ncbi:MAG: polysaccharide deacetylase family protein [Thomasclavelia sp.]|nr:polysaccharide deacetylase family protein [Thomasclavelia sp.]
MKKIVQIIISILIGYVIIGLGWTSQIVISHYLKVDGLPVLGYHGVVSDKEKKDVYSNNLYVLSVSTFKQQMKYLYDNNYDTLSMDEVNNYYHGASIKKKSVCLTFDDGCKNFNTIVKPIIKKYNFKATSFVIASKVDKNKMYLSNSDLKNDNNVEYYSHSYNLHHFDKNNRRYKKIERISKEEIKLDFIHCNKIVSTKYFAFPYGISSNNAKEYLKSSNTKLAFGYNENRNMTRNDDQFLLPRYLIFDKIPFNYFKWIIQ